MSSSGISSATPDDGNQLNSRLHEDGERLQYADGEAADDRRDEREEPTEHGGRECGHDEERVGAGHQRNEWSDEHAGGSRNHRADGPVRQGDALG